MRKLILCLPLLTIIVMSGYSQATNYSKFRGELGLTGAVLTGKMSGGGFGAFSEFKYNVTDNISAGIRIGADLLLGSDVNGSGGSYSIGAKAAASFLAKGEYYFTTSKVRPFAGLGLGLYTSSSSSASSDATATASGGNSFGLMPQVGVNLGSFRLGVQYHIITGKEQVVAGVGSPEQIGRNWLGFDVGFTIGGKSLN